MNRRIAFLLVIMPSRDSYEAEARSVGARRLLDRAEARAAELELPTLSLRVRLGTAGGAELYMDFCHPTAAGNEAIAAARPRFMATVLPKVSKSARSKPSRLPFRDIWCRAVQTPSGLKA